VGVLVMGHASIATPPPRPSGTLQLYDMKGTFVQRFRKRKAKKQADKRMWGAWKKQCDNLLEVT